MAGKKTYVHTTRPPSGGPRRTELHDARQTKHDIFQAGEATANSGELYPSLRSHYDLMLVREAGPSWLYHVYPVAP